MSPFSPLQLSLYASGLPPLGPPIYWWDFNADPLGPIPNVDPNIPAELMHGLLYSGNGGVVANPTADISNLPPFPPPAPQRS